MSSAEDRIREHIPTAVRTWARQVFGAPRRLEDLVTNVESRDEVIERVATLVVRREIRETRTATTERRSTVCPVDRNAIDPFAYTEESLRVASQYIAQCTTCAASGLVQCDTCRGSCQMDCRNCSGTGKERSQKTNRLIKCKVCKATGRVACARCTGVGSIRCQACAGSGHQLAWLTFQQSDSWNVTLAPNTPIVHAHPALRHSGTLSSDALAAFAIVTSTANDSGPIDLSPRDGAERAVIGSHAAKLDRRLERIAAQQYMKLAVVRRDVTYEMCGTSATIVLSGVNLAGARTPDSTAPIRRRLILWVTLVALFLAAAIALRVLFVGTSSYFANIGAAALGLAAFGALITVPAAGALLRAWRGGLRFRGAGAAAAVLAVVATLSLAAIPVLGIASRPSPNEVKSALASGQLEQAHAVIGALKEIRGDSEHDVLELEDEVTLADADQKAGAARLQLLDAVAARRGSAAASAAAKARNQRIDDLHALLAARDATKALAMLDHSFPTDRADDIAELRAQAYEVNATECKTDACRFENVALAASAHLSEARTSRAADLKAVIVAALSPSRVTEKQITARLAQVHELRDQAADTLDHVKDAELRTLATAAIAFADTERAKVPVIGSDLAVAKEVLGDYQLNGKNVPTLSLDDTTVFLATGGSGRCNGVYVIGRGPDHAVKGASWSPERILSQAIGRPATIRPPSTGQLTSNWYEGGVPVVARWRNSALVELRIGDATP